MTNENLGTQSQLSDLFILHTDIDKRSEFLSIKYDLEKMSGVKSCTIDLDDCDKVLRVECENIPIGTIVDEVTRHGYFCEELAD